MLQSSNAIALHLSLPSLRPVENEITRHIEYYTTERQGIGPEEIINNIKNNRQRIA